MRLANLRDITVICGSKIERPWSFPKIGIQAGFQLVVYSSWTAYFGPISSWQRTTMLVEILSGFCLVFGSQILLQENSQALL